MMKRKILSILLTLTMTLTLLPATAMAEDVKGVQCDGGEVVLSAASLLRV